MKFTLTTHTLSLVASLLASALLPGATAIAQDAPAANSTPNSTPNPTSTPATRPAKTKAAKSPKSPKSPKAQTVDLTPFEAKTYEKDGHTLPYRILYPENMKPGQKYPLFLFLHGMGKRGTDNKSQLDRGGELFLTPANRKQYPCIALYPQAPLTSAFVQIVDGDNQPTTGGFSAYAKPQSQGGKDPANAHVALTPYGNMVMDVLNQLIASGAVDTDRIYIAGSSMGGFSTYHFITQYPDLFAAAAPMAGATDLSKMSAWAGKVPIWIVHGANDPTVSPEGDRAVVAKLKQMGVTNFRYNEYPNTGHDSWTKAFAEPDFMSWFFSHSKQTNQANKQADKQ